MRPREKQESTVFILCCEGETPFLQLMLLVDFILIEDFHRGLLNSEPLKDKSLTLNTIRVLVLQQINYYAWVLAMY